MMILFVQSAEGGWIPNTTTGQWNAGCIDLSNSSSDIDYFPDKVKPVSSEYWDIQYYKTYKVLSNKANNATYLLYQCGSSSLLPSDVSMYNATIEVPASKISVAYVNTIAYLEQLNMLDSIVAYTDDISYIGSPCFLERIANHEVYVVRNSSELDSLLSSDSLASSILNSNTVVAFSSPWGPDVFTQNVVTSTESEKTNEGIFEWVKFYSAFFNLEAMANDIYNAAQDRAKCISEGALNTVTSADGIKPTLLWAYYSDYCGGWDIGNCPNYYCEFADACSATIVNVTKGSGSITNDICGDYTYFTIEEVMNIGLDADYWIFPGSNWDATYANFSQQLDQFKSVKNEHVYDVQGSGFNAWFEERYAEYYDVQQDFCSVVGTTVGLKTRNGWFRNVLKNQTVGGLGQCTSTMLNETSILPYDYRCDLTLADDVTDVANGSNTGNPENMTTVSTNTSSKVSSNAALPFTKAISSLCATLVVLSMTSIFISI